MDKTSISPEVLDFIKSQLTNVTCSKSSTLSFLKGFVLGQCSVIIVVILVLKYLFTEDVKRVNRVCAINEKKKRLYTKKKEVVF